MSKVNVFAKKVIRKKTNFGDLCKQTVILAVCNKEPVLIIEKLILGKTDGFMKEEKPIKVFKELGLYCQYFSIRLETFADIVGWLESL